MTKRVERALVAAAALVAAFVHGAVRDPRYLFCDDLGLFVALQRYTYLHPWDAWRGIPSPSFLFGTSVHDPDFPSAIPIVPALLSRIAPSDPYALAAFEWHVTSVCVAVAVVGAYLLTRRFGVAVPVALAAAVLYPFLASTSRDYHVAFWLRGKLLLPLALVLAARLVEKRRWRDAALAAAAWILVLGHSALGFWIVLAGGLFAGIMAVRERSALVRAVRETPREAIRAALPFLAAGAAIAAVLLPPMLRFGRSMQGSAWAALLGSSGDTQLDYLLAGHTYTLARLLPTGLVTGLSPLATAGVLLAGILAVRRVALPTATKVALALAACAAPLFFFQKLPGAFVADGDHVLAYGVRVPKLLASLAHSPERTWLVQMELAGMFAAVTAFGAWTGDRRRRFFDGAAVVLAHLALCALAGAEVEDAALSAALVAIVLACAAHPRAVLALPALALVFVVPRWSSMLEANARRGGAAEAKVVEQIRALGSLPPELQHHYDTRIGTYAVVRSVPLLADSGGTFCCGARLVSTDLLAFFQTAGAVTGLRLPYQVDIDWRRVDELGLLPLFGVRWWVTAETMGPPFAPVKPSVPLGAGMVLHEDLHAFPEARPVSTWEAATDHEDAVRRVLALGARHELGNVDVVIGDAGRAGVRLRTHVTAIEPGRIDIETSGVGAPFIVATTEIADGAWTALVDENPAPVLIVDALFVGVKVTEGTHSVTLRHRLR